MIRGNRSTTSLMLSNGHCYDGYVDCAGRVGRRCGAFSGLFVAIGCYWSTCLCRLFSKSVCRMGTRMAMVHSME